MAYNHFAASDPELAPMLAAIPLDTASFTANLEQTRTFFNSTFIEIQRAAQRPHLPLESTYVIREDDICIENHSIRVRIYLPATSEGETFPLLFWVHGGGWVFGTLEQDDYTLKIITVELRMAIVSVDYRLAPETPFPGGLYDCFAALKWAAENAGKLGADLKKGFVVGGQSAGSNYAAVLAQLAKADPFFSTHSLTGQALSIPLLCHPEAYPDEYKAKMTSFVQNADAPLLAARHLLDYYGKLQAMPDNPELSPLLCNSLDGLPPAYIQVCGLDPARDEGLVYAERLEACGVQTKVDVYPGVPHGFHLSFPETKVARKYNEEFKGGIRWLLSQSTSD